jgi:flavodoxin
MSFFLQSNSENKFIRIQLTLAPMKVLIAYYSETGNTKKIAEAIYEEASSHHEVVLGRVKKLKVTQLDEYDLVILGAACHDSDLARPLKKMLAELPRNPKYKLAGFFTHATYMPGDSERNTASFDRWAAKCGPSFENTCQEKNIQFLGYFHCMGVPSKPIERFIHREIIVADDEWQEYLLEVRTHPNAQDLLNAKEFTQEVLAKYPEE